MELSNYLSQLASLAHESRLRIFRLLVPAGPSGLNPSVISEQLNMPAATLSFHLKELHQAGLVIKERQGRSIKYSANYTAMNGLIDFLRDNCCADAPCQSCQP